MLQVRDAFILYMADARISAAIHVSRPVINTVLMTVHIYMTLYIYNQHCCIYCMYD